MDLLQSLVPRLAELLDDEVMRALETQCRWRSYPQGQLIHRRGDRTQGFSLIRTGHVNGSNVGVDGSTLTTSVLGPGHCFGEFTVFAGLPRTHDLWALDDVEIGTVAARPFLDLVDAHPELTRALLTIALRRSYVMLEFLDSLRRLPLDMRLAKLLLGHAARTREDTVVIKQEALAFTLGVTRMSVSSALTKLEEAGLLQRGYGRITVNQAALSEWIMARDLVPALVPDQIAAHFTAT